MNLGILNRFLSVTGSKIGRLVITVVTTPILVRLLGSDRYGDYAFLLSTLSIIMIFLTGSVYPGMRKYIVENRSFDQWQEYVFSYYARIALLTAAVASAMVLILSTSDLPTTLFGNHFDLYFGVLAVIILLRQIFMTAKSTLMGFALEKYSEPLDVGRKAIQAGAAILFLYLGFGLMGVLTAHVLALSVITIIYIFLMRPHIKLFSVFDTLPAEFPRQELSHFNFFSILLLFFISTIHHFDILLLRPIMGASPTGYYKAALTVVEFTWFIPTAIQTVLIHSTSELWSQGSKAEVQGLVSQAARYTLLLTTLLVIGLAVLAEPFLKVYFGPEFVQSVQPLIILLPGALCFAVSRPILGVGQGKGDLRIFVFVTGIGAALNLVLNLLLIPQYGTTGAAIATSIGYGSMLIFNVYSARLVGFDPFSDLRLVRTIATAVPTIALLVILQSEISSQIESLIIIPPTGLFVFALLAFATKAIRIEEARNILSDIT